MKTLLYKIVYLFLFIPAIVLATGTKEKGKYTKEKSIKKEFSVDNNALLKIKNSYGNLDVTSWNENRIIVQINITVNGNNEEKVISRLKNIDVDFKSSSQLVSAETILNNQTKSWWDKISENWTNESVNIKVNYTVKVPINNSVDLNNDYGSITLNKIKGTAKIHCDYGQIIIGELMADDNYIAINYTHNNSIKYMKSGKINADYSGFELEKSENINLSADYSQSYIGFVKNLKYNCDYGGLHIKNVEKMIGNGDYLNTKVENVITEIDIKSDYGSINILNLSATTKSANIKTDYTGVNLGYSSALNFDFKLKSSYGSIKLDSEVNIVNKSKDNFDKDYQGYHGIENSGTFINITSSYGGIKLQKN